MVVEPASMCWLSGRFAAKRDGETWQAELQSYTGLEYVVSDAGTGLQKGIRAVQREHGKVRHGLDVFHTLREGSRALRRQYGRVSRAVERAERYQKDVDRRARKGESRSGWGSVAKRSWQEAERRLDAAAATEQAWNECKAVLELFRPDGQLNDRAWAETVVAQAGPHLAGAEWGKVRRLLQRRETFTFLDRLQEGLAPLGLEPETQRAVLQWEWTRRQLKKCPVESAEAARLRALHLARSVQLAKTRPDWEQLVKEVQKVLRQAWRASSLVEGINSVARMQQARHRKMTQGLLDLKRLYWNLRRFRTGTRRRQTAYELLGLRLDTTDWWELLKLTPEQLQQQLSN
jgi:hypothetical protein